MKKLVLFGILFLFFIVNIFAQTDSVDQKKVYIFDVDEEIAPPVVRRMGKAFAQAKEQKVDLIVLHMNTYGGELSAADTMRTKILKSSIPIIVFIDNNAASAGALISIACDSIYMQEGASIGAATVVNQNAEALPDKYQSYMRAMMRSTAEAKGRNPEIAEAMVDQDLYVTEVSDSGKVLTFTTSEAIANGFCEAQVKTIDEAIQHYGFVDYEKYELKLSATDTIIDFLISPYVHGILIMVIVGGIYFELQSPGIGFPSIASIAAAMLYFAPLYVEGLAENWEILVFIAGLVLIILEVFVIPGFGVAGVAGITLVVGGLVLSLLANVRFDFSFVQMNTILEAVFIVLLSVFGAIILSFQSAKVLFTNPRFGFALHTVQDHNKGFVAADLSLSMMIGQDGTAFSMLRPAGKVMIDGDVFDAVCRESFIEKGEPVRVIDFQNAQLIVIQLENEISE
ncbi:MAG: nodulation protein NfeD [Bacteroidetes bacterium]|nr:MAG: nodulation protein NfeD [Bacteroidota bacterium]